MIIFLHIPKTAGTTFNFILENTFAFSHCHTGHTKQEDFTQDDLEFARCVFPSLRSIAGHNLTTPLELDVPNAFHMTILREPIARTLAHYQATINWGTNRLPFEESLRTIPGMENPHVKMMAGGRDLDKAKRYLERCSFVGLTEKFDLSMRVLEKLSPYPLNLNYLRKTTATDNRIKQELLADPRMMELARDHNQLDLALYDFAVKEIFPKLCAKAGMKPDEKVASLDNYTSELHPRFLLSRFYNQSIWRQLCKRRAKRTLNGATASAAASVAAGVMSNLL